MKDVHWSQCSDGSSRHRITHKVSVGRQSGGGRVTLIDRPEGWSMKLAHGTKKNSKHERGSKGFRSWPKMVWPQGRADATGVEELE